MRCLKTLPYQLEGTIDVIEPPYRDTFYSFESIDITGLVITINVRGRMPITVDWRDLSVRPKYKDNRHTGSQIVSVIYSTMIGKLPVNIIKQDYASIEVLQHPTYNFPYGALFNKGNIVVEGTFERFGKEIIPNDELIFSIEDGTPVTGDMTELVITTDNGISASIPINVTETMVGLELIPPTRTEIEWGQPISYEGMEVYAIYRGRTERRVRIPLNQCDITPTEGTLVTDDESTLIYVTYNGFTATTSITTIPHLEGLFIITPPDKTVYKLKEEIDYTGLVVKFKYNGGSYYEDVEDYTTSPTILRYEMIDLETNEFTYSVLTYKDGEPWVVEGQMMWDGEAEKQLVYFRDWCPWEYREGAEIWDSSPGIIVYGWVDGEGNRIRFPYETTALNIHNWEALGMHPLYAIGSDVPDHEFYRWVRKESVAFDNAFGAFDNILHFLGSDLQSFNNTLLRGHYVDELYLPYCTECIGTLPARDVEWGKDARIKLTMQGDTFDYYLTVKELTLNSTFTFEEELVTRLYQETTITFDYYKTPLLDGLRYYEELGSFQGYYSEYGYRFVFYWDDGSIERKYLPDGPPNWIYHINTPQRDSDKLLLTLNSSTVVDNLGLRIKSSLPFIKEIRIPPELEEDYKEMYGDYLAAIREDGVEVRVYFRVEDFDRWIPEPYIE